MNSALITGFLVLTVSVCYSRSLSEVDLPKLLHCEHSCRKLYHRSCSNLPPYCGSCVGSYQEKDGLCLKRGLGDEISPEREIDEIDALRQQAKQNGGQSEHSELSSDSGGGGQLEGVNLQAAAGAAPQSSAQLASGEPQHTGHPPAHAGGIFIAVVVGCSVAGLVGLIVAGVCWYRLQKNVKAASDVDYPAYGVTGPTKDRVTSPGDRKLAQSAQMYHYQHQKQQMIAMEKAQTDLNKAGSEEDTDEENEEGDYTVFECPGLAPTGEMEVKNPLFNEDTPVTPSAGDDTHK